MGPLVLQTFGAHWTAVTGARKLSGIDDPDVPVGKPIGGLGLAAAAVSIIYLNNTTLTYYYQVERALTLVHDGIITREMIQEAQGHCPKLLKSVNTTTGKESTATVTFNEEGWGRQSRSFTKSTIKTAQSAHKFEKIEKAAQAFTKGNTCLMESHTTEVQDGTSDDDDDWANLADNDSNDEE